MFRKIVQANNLFFFNSRFPTCEISRGDWELPPPPPLLLMLLLLTIFWWWCWFAEIPPPPWKNISLFSNWKHYLLCTNFFVILLNKLFSLLLQFHTKLNNFTQFFLPFLCVITDSTSTWNYMITLIFWKNSEGKEKI